MYEIIRKCIKWSAAGIRLIYWKLRYRKQLMICGRGMFPYIGKHTKFLLQKGGMLSLGRGTYLDDYVYIEVGKNANISIGLGNYFNKYCRLIAVNEISIGSNNLYGPNVSVYDHNHRITKNGVEKAEFDSAPTRVGEGNWFCTNVVLTAGVQVGNNNVVGANCVVPHSLGNATVYAGVPAKKIREI